MNRVRGSNMDIENMKKLIAEAFEKERKANATKDKSDYYSL